MEMGTDYYAQEVVRLACWIGADLRAGRKDRLAGDWDEFIMAAWRLGNAVDATMAAPATPPRVAHVLDYL